MSSMHRIGLLVPSSNTTMETEVPALLRARERARPEDTFSFHSARLRMEDVTPEGLRAMNEETGRATAELARPAAGRRRHRVPGRDHGAGLGEPPRGGGGDRDRFSSRSMLGRPSSRPRARSSTRCTRSARAGSGSSRPISRSSRGSSSRTSRTRASRSEMRSASRSPTNRAVAALDPHDLERALAAPRPARLRRARPLRPACRCARSRCSRRWNAAAGCRRCPPRRRRRGRSCVRSTSSRSLRVLERSFVLRPNASCRRLRARPQGGRKTVSAPTKCPSPPLDGVTRSGSSLRAHCSRRRRLER